MKVKISPDGCLLITPESELELYAVSQWWANFNQGMHNSAMHVARSLEEPAADPSSQPLPAPTTQRAQQLREIAGKTINEVLAHREEVLEAFIAKYSAEPDCVEQVEQRQADGTIRWYVRLKPTPPVTPSTQRAQRLLDELDKGGLPAVLKHLAVAWDHTFGMHGEKLLEDLAAELEGKR